MGARVEALHGKVDALHEKLDAVPRLLRSLFAAVYEKLDAVPGLMGSLLEKLDALRRGGNKRRTHHGRNPIQSTDAAWRSVGGDAP